MQSLYLTLMLIGLAIFVIAIFFDFGHHDFDFGHHDFDHADGDSPGLFSIRTISAFLAGFGVSGLVAINLQWGVIGQLAFGFFTGFALAAISYGIMYLFYKQQGWKLTDSSKLSGMTGLVTTATGKQGIGEATVDGKYFSFREKTNQPLILGDKVKVIESVEGTLIVEKSL